MRRRPVSQARTSCACRGRAARSASCYVKPWARATAAKQSLFRGTASSLRQGLGTRAESNDSRSMTAQPTGTVTLLFTDVEGSTRLLRRLGGQRYADALGLHRRLLREAFERYGGYEVDNEGDSFFVAFEQ